jgi:hypothetical protein
MCDCLGGGTALERKRSALSETSPLGAYLSPEEIVALARACSTHAVRPGRVLPESAFYLVVSGQVEVREAASQQLLCTKQPNSFFTRFETREVTPAAAAAPGRWSSAWRRSRYTPSRSWTLTRHDSRTVRSV